MSVDIIDSTSIKTSYPKPAKASRGKLRRMEGQVASWPRLFRDFYRDFPALLAAGYKELPKHPKGSGQKVVPAEVWKTLGDEIVFHATISDCRHAVDHVLALQHAVSKFNESDEAGAEREQQRKPIRAKATAWLVGLPVTNVEIDGVNGRHPDYIGPWVDAGFRLSKFSSERRLVVSVELADVLVETLLKYTSHYLPNTSSLKFGFDGYQVLRGLYENRDYPIIYVCLECLKPHPRNEFLARHRPAFQPDAALKDFIGQFFAQHRYIRKPFICDDNGNLFHSIPADLEQIRRNLQESVTTYSPTRLDPGGRKGTVTINPKTVLQALKKHTPT